MTASKAPKKANEKGEQQNTKLGRVWMDTKKVKKARTKLWTFHYKG